MISSYITARDEYESLNESERNRLVFAYFGLAIYCCQCVEQTFSMLVPTDSVFKETAKITSILDKREYLVHKYFKAQIEKSFSKAGQLEMIKYFCHLIDESKELDDLLKTYY